MVLSFKSSSCMSDNIPLSNVSFENIFFWVCGLSFHSFGLFCSIEQKFIILMKSSISVFSFMDPTFHVISYLSPHSRSSRLSPILCSRSFIVLHFTFRAVLHFEFNFCEGYKVCVQILFCVCMSSPSIICWKDCFYLLPLLLCQRSADFIHVSLFLNSLLRSIDRFVYSFTHTTWFLLWNFFLNFLFFRWHLVV